MCLKRLFSHPIPFLVDLVLATGLLRMLVSQCLLLVLQQQRIGQRHLGVLLEMISLLLLLKLSLAYRRYRDGSRSVHPLGLRRDLLLWEGMLEDGWVVIVLILYHLNRRKLLLDQWLVLEKESTWLVRLGLLTKGVFDWTWSWYKLWLLCLQRTCDIGTQARRLRRAFLWSIIIHCTRKYASSLQHVHVLGHLGQYDSELLMLLSGCLGALKLRPHELDDRGKTLKDLLIVVEYLL